jgi:UDP-N-acetylmuramate--alanine ligase
MKIHFIGIGGIGVSALAKYYLENGHKISGSDLYSSEITQALEKSGAKITIDLKPKTLNPETDLVIFSPAIPENHPELLDAKRYNLKTLSYPQALGELTKDYYTIAVSGTHGKSTTCAILSLILIKAGLNPTVIVGTKLWEFNNSNFYLGGRPKSKYKILGKKYLVIEADEHFASFLNYWPRMIVLTNIDADHLDFYKNLNNIVETFKKYVLHLPKDGILTANHDDKNVKKVLSDQFKIKKFFLKQPEAKKIKKLLKIPGEHMVANALATLTAARALGVPDRISYKAISQYNGAWRRFEILQEKPFVLISDYGHNPQKMLATLKGAREKYPKRKIWCVYQPHQYQRTKFLFKEFVKAFRQAPVSQIIITDIFDVAGREDREIKKEVNSEKLVKAIKRPCITYLPKEQIIDRLKQNIKPNDIVIIMGAGDIYLICDKLLNK